VLFYKLLIVDEPNSESLINFFFPWTSPKGPFGTECGNLEDLREKVDRSVTPNT
jgi:hypothetical protein